MRSKLFTSLAAAALLSGLLAGAAYAFPSGGTPVEPGPDTITWTGQGVTFDGTDWKPSSEICPGTVPAGVDPNSYLHWIFTTDGGSADTDATLTLGGSGTGSYSTTKDSGGAFHFYTPYVEPDPSMLTAVASFTVITTGNGSWNLVISHGCGGGGGGQGDPLGITKTADGSYTTTYDWTIDKTVDTDTVYSSGGGESQEATFTVSVTKDAGADSDWLVAGQIEVTNPNDFDVMGVEVTDSVDNGGTCTVTGGSGVTVPANGSVVLGYSCTYASAPDLTGNNTAVVTWPGSPDLLAGSANFVIAFSMTQTIVNSEIDVTDTNGQSWHFADSGSATYSMTYTDPAGTCTEHQNTATITQTGQSASATVTDCQGADLTVTKTATPSYDRTYTWTIDKAVDKTYVEKPDGTATFNYTVTVGHDAGTDGNWKVAGEITVTNPNDWQDVVVDISDELPGGTCTVTGGTDVTVPMGGSAVVSYECVFASDPGTGTNTATATWDAATYWTPNGSASGTAGFTFGDPTNVIDECVFVTDSYAGTLGTVCVGAANPAVFTYSRTVPVPAASTCMSYDNTATFTTNDTGATGSASQTVTVCSYQYRLTPGYWKNHLAYDPKTPNNPWVAKYLTITLGSYAVDSTAKATAVFNGMNCSKSGDQNSVGCLAGHLLAAKLNVANGANPCIGATITSADAFLVGIPYVGPAGKYVLSAAQRATAISLKSALDGYNNGGYCH
ncbi:MAG: hypothetical protein MUE82_01420 [Chloroflexi bacterium]|jgi:hypothetical protein|nr:hypothetical protein [Chloroflexota bacterium]